MVDALTFTWTAFISRRLSVVAEVIIRSGLVEMRRKRSSCLLVKRGRPEPGGALWPCGPVALWLCGPVALWLCQWRGTALAAVGRRNSSLADVSPLLAWVHRRSVRPGFGHAPGCSVDVLVACLMSQRQIPAKCMPTQPKSRMNCVINITQEFSRAPCGFQAGALLSQPKQF